MSAGQVTDNGAWTVPLNLHAAEWAQLSLPVTLTVEVPSGKVLPLGGLAVAEAPLQPPLVPTEKVTAAPPGPVASAFLLTGQVAARGALTVCVTGLEVLRS